MMCVYVDLSFHDKMVTLLFLNLHIEMVDEWLVSV